MNQSNMNYSKNLYEIPSVEVVSVIEAMIVCASTDTEPYTMNDQSFGDDAFE